MGCEFCEALRIQPEIEMLTISEPLCLGSCAATLISKLIFCELILPSSSIIGKISFPLFAITTLFRATLAYIFGYILHCFTITFLFYKGFLLHIAYRNSQVFRFSKFIII